MSQENVERLMKGYEAFAGGDIEPALALLDPDIEVEVHTERPDMERSLYRGYEGFLANIGELTDVFDDFTIEPEAVDDRGDRIMVAVRASGRGKLSGAAIEVRLFHVWTVVNDLATRLEVYSEREQALAALETAAQ